MSIKPSMEALEILYTSHAPDCINPITVCIRILFSKSGLSLNKTFKNAKKQKELIESQNDLLNLLQYYSLPLWAYLAN